MLKLELSLSVGLRIIMQIPIFTDIIKKWILSEESFYSQNIIWATNVYAIMGNL